ncbi:low temperature requirement protein A [Actinomadura oligospora]|uniref:low temperature requirement protein A n=1 Tax=Actinomadura oligospora TaxID=111804 RepID=UPI0004796E0B|nr:low temperature requirement protein A [Actinomadura oligospora]
MAVVEPDGASEPEQYPVTTLELFFDLVFVFAITQLTGVLAHDMTLRGLAEVVLMFGVLWWMYAGYAWLTNMTAPTTVGRRLLVLTGMGGFFMIALATPGGFGSGGVVWGLGYLILVLAHVVLFAQANTHILRVLPANLTAAALIIAAGTLGHGAPVYVLWTLALVVPVVQPYIVPPGGRFDIRPGHIVERHGLLVMITIGESVVAIGVGAGHQKLTAGLIATVLLGLALAAAIWWTYFSRDDTHAEHALTAADPAERANMTMSGYFYAHIPLIVGIIVLAAGVKSTVAESWDPLPYAPSFALAGGTALFLLGDAWFRRIVRIGPSRIRIAAAFACVVGVPLAHWSAAAGLAALTGVLAAAQLAEHTVRARRAEPAGV